MKFLIDAGVGKKACDILKTKGYDVKSILDIDPAMTDLSILQLALTDKRIVVTMDKDFGELVFNSGLDHEGVLLLRLEDMNGQMKSEIINAIIENFSDKIQGLFCVDKRGRFWIRQK
jgi:predicted nuclease of predicted toxin-antitoxin system